MRTIRLNRAILFLWINPKKETACSLFIYWVGFPVLATHSYTFSLKDISVSGIKKFYATLSNDYSNVVLFQGSMFLEPSLTYQAKSSF